MQEEYSGKLLDDGHLSIPKAIINKLKINRESSLRVSVRVVKKAKRERILAYAGLLSDLTQQEGSCFDESIERKSLFGRREVDV